MTIFSALLWVIVIVATILQYVLGYFNKKILGSIFPIVFTFFLIILFFKGKDPNFFQSVVVFIIGNIGLIGYFISGNNKRKKKIEKEMNIMKAKDISRKK